MSNAAPHGSSGPLPPLGSFNNTTAGTAPPPGLFPSRRHSYASVLSGLPGSNLAPPPASNATRTGLLSHLLHVSTPSGPPQQSSLLGHSRHSSRGAEIDPFLLTMPWSRQPQSWPWNTGHGGSSFGGWAQEMPFFIPSYLQGSRHAEKLEEEHRLRTSSTAAAQKDMRSAQSSNTGSLSTSSSSINLHKMVPSHRGMTHDIIERSPLPEESVAPLPTRWNIDDRDRSLEVQADGLEVRFSGASKPHEEAASIRADHPIPKQCGIYYFEVTVVSKGKEGLIGIGFSGPKVPLNRLPGWEPESWAYHGDDGLSFACTPSGKSYGPKFTSLDVIGCGINFRTGCAFFTKNGEDLGIAFNGIKSDRLYPSVGMKKPGEHLRVNFGQTPFVFDIDNMVRKERLLIRQEVNEASTESLQPGLDETQLIHRLVSQYLAHEGYVETARAFAEGVREEAKALRGDAGGVSHLDAQEDQEAIQRQKIRSAILEGDIDKAIKLTRTHYPDVLKNNEDIYFRLRCRKFIEMIRKCTDLQSAIAGKRGGSTNDGYNDIFDHEMELDEQLHNDNAGHSHGHSHHDHAATSGDRMDTEDGAAGAAATAADLHAKHAALLQETLRYGQELRSEFASDPRREVKQALEDTFALIAYDNVHESSLAPLLEARGRVPVAEELNGAILVSLGKPSSSALERVVQQTEALVDALAEDGGPGAFVHVRRDYMGIPPTEPAEVAAAAAAMAEGDSDGDDEEGDDVVEAGTVV